MQPAVEIPHAIRHSRLMRDGGFATYEGLLGDDVLTAMTAEAAEAYESCTRSDVADCGDRCERGGTPARRFSSSHGGELQGAFYNADWMLAFLGDLASSRVAPTGALATFSYYVSPGDYLDVHRDIIGCDLAVITCLSDSAPELTSGSLCVYPDRVAESVTSIRASRERGGQLVHLSIGQTIVMFGGVVPHRLDPVATSQQRVVSVMCYSTLSSGHQAR
jgi:hypothetical protein